jgi:hypothetical protein
MSRRFAERLVAAAPAAVTAVLSLRRSDNLPMTVAAEPGGLALRSKITSLTAYAHG